MFIDELLVLPTDGVTSPARNIPISGLLSSMNTHDFWSFDGSLTTPPCTENVKWAVLKEVQPISTEQLSKFTALWAKNPYFGNGNGNNRKAQPLNDRTVYFYSEDALFMNYKDVAVIVLGVLLAVFSAIFFAVGCGMCLKKTKKN